MTFEEARDEIFAIFKEVWDPTGYTAVYNDVRSQVPASEIVWARVTLRHATAGAATLGHIGGKRVYNRSGTLFVQVFTPSGDGSTSGLRAAQKVVDAYQRVHGNVQFANARLNEIGSNGAFEQFNVLVDFSYTDMR